MKRFTLVELLVTIVIIVILLSIGISGIREVRSSTLGYMGTYEMKSAVESAQRFS